MIVPPLAGGRWCRRHQRGRVQRVHVKNVLKIVRSAGRSVLRFDSGPGPLRVVVSPNGDEYKVSVTGFTFVSPVLHDGILKPSSFVRTWQ